MSGQDPVRRAGDRVWSWLLGAFAVVIGLQVLLAMVRPLLPWLVLIGAIVAAVWLWNRARWS